MIKKETQKGITLISLVITIIILLILATVAINLAIDSDGVFKKAESARNNWNNRVVQEDTTIDSLMDMMYEFDSGELLPGLYKTGTKRMLKSWEALKEEGSIVVESGKLVSIAEELSGDLIIDEEVEQLEDYSIAGDCGGYVNEHELTGLVLSGNLTEIPNYSFANFKKLTSITIPNSVTSIGRSAFSECSGLTSITIPNSVTSISNSVFSGCSGLTSITIPDSVTSIGDYAFSGCSVLTSITIPDSVASIGYSAFYNCRGLTSITVEEGNEVYDSRENSNAIIKTETHELVFGCNNTIIPNSVTSIASNAFYGSGLTSITIPDSVASIRNYAFAGCSGLTSITVEEGNEVYDSRENSNAIIKTETNELILGCKNTIIPNGVTSIGDSAFHGSGLTSITIPNSVTSIGGAAFYNCSGLTSITISNSVASIGQNAFYNCSGLTSITIPNSVTSIDYGAFRLCSNLTINCEAATQPEGWTYFWNISNCPVVWGYTAGA